MNILTIHHLCFYLEDIGIIDQASISAFLSLYSFASNKIKENTNSNFKKNSLFIFENTLCAYLKKIFSFEKNFKIFSNKIISKFKQHFMIKQYNGLTLLFTILSKQLNLFKIQSFYKILKKQEEINISNLITSNNNNAYSRSNTYTNINSPKNNNNLKINKKKILDSNRIKKILNNRNEDNKYDAFNKSFDFLKINNNIFNTTLPSSISRNSQAKNIQLEFHKKQFLSKIKREHIVKFKRSESNSAKKLKKNNSNKEFKYMLLNTVSPIINQKVIYNGQSDINNTYNINNLNEKNNNNNKFKLQKQNKENALPKILKEDYSAISDIINLNTFINTSSKIKNKEKVGHIIRNGDKNNIKSFSNRGKLVKQNSLSLDEINKIKQRLEELNYFNLNKEN